MSAVLTQRLVAVAGKVAQLGHGQKSGYLQQVAAELGMSRDKLYRELKK
ncbi:hypothetical protein [Paralysiella testudinis]